MRPREEGYYVPLPEEDPTLEEKNIPLIPEKKSRMGTFAQGAFAVIGFGVIVLYIKSSQNCAADLRCIDKILLNLPEKSRTGILIFCGGTEFALTSALCAMDAIPDYINYINQYPNITKFLKGGGILLAAAAATMEQLFIAIKAFDTVDQAFAAWTTWLMCFAAIPMNLFGALNMVKDVPRVISHVN